MKPIIFFDIEISNTGKKVLDIGAIKSDGTDFHSSSVKDFSAFLADGIANGIFICGHNIIKHDLPYLKKALSSHGCMIEYLKPIDTLLLSALLFVSKPYHKLVKDDKLQTDALNNPKNDALTAKHLFYDEVLAFNDLADDLQQIYYLLLHDQAGFSAFFAFISYDCGKNHDIETLISETYDGVFCHNASIKELFAQYPVELAYALALINCHNHDSITPAWVLKNYPMVETILLVLRNTPCLNGCHYCDKVLDINKGLRDYFGFDRYRTFSGVPLQQLAVQAAVENKSLLAIFPTGGGKSLTFQIPALMAGRNTKGLTVVISPLQSLMKDQVDNLEKNGITEAVTINGMLNPIERGQSFSRVADGSASLLYISPESLRSKSIEHLLLGRNIVRFVIDEAHCFSSWGQDFRVDYLYIGVFIKRLQDIKKLQQSIAVSCFTATAKQKVVEDIVDYFKQHLSLDLQVFETNTHRTNLRYKVFNSKDDQEKYRHLRNLIESNQCPTIVYVARTRKAYHIAKRLSEDGFDAKPYHGKMDIEEKNNNQNQFIAGHTQIMVATSAFGMGVDKKDIGMVIHYDISDSLENYVQESGRAGRDQNLKADCYVLFNEEDLSKHFHLLNQTKLSVKEIQQVWRAIKNISKYRSTVSNSALEIARKAGWDDNVFEIETRVITAIAALEQSGYVKRGQNCPRIFANSILTKNAQQAIEKINASLIFSPKQKTAAVRIIKKLFSSKSKKHANEEQAESRIDYISDHLGIAKEQVIKIINLLKEEKILADSKDLTAFIQVKQKLNHSLNTVKSHASIERYLLPVFSSHQYEHTIHNLKALNEEAESHGCVDTSPYKIKTIINFWSIQKWIETAHQNTSKNHISVKCRHLQKELQVKLEKRHVLSEFIVDYLFNKIDNHTNQMESLVEFSVHELKAHYLKQPQLFKLDISIGDIEDTLFYLSRIGAVKIEGGFLVLYNKMVIDRLEHNNKIQYKKEDYKKLDQFYLSKMQQIHIVGEYAKKLINDYHDALGFVDDYFQLNYQKFLKKYFKGSRRDALSRNITAEKFEQLFGSLSPQQLKIINDKQSQNILVTAGPGSGKTRVLVHKLASLLLMEDIKHEGLLMLTFSRAAASEFKKRLLKLINNAANYVEITTFHAYCFDLLGKVGNLDRVNDIIALTIEKIKNGDVEANRICKTVVVIDEAQDMDVNEYGLIKALMHANDEMRIVAVGDDDQNIYAFRGADSRYFGQLADPASLAKDKKAQKYELIKNYRSRKNLVEYANIFAEKINVRFKNTAIVSDDLADGSIRVIGYSCVDKKTNQMTSPVVNDIICSDLSGSTAVLTTTNDQALQITGLLLKNKIPAKLIQSQDGFNLYNLVEIRAFIAFLNLNDAIKISTHSWNNAKKQFSQKYHNSRNYEICKNLLISFQECNPKDKYLSDFKVFIKESKIEDFAVQNRETIHVSTIHKAKGKEYDNVFIVLANFNPVSDDAKRLLYVAMTRAKHNLCIHYNGTFLNDIQVSNLIHNINTQRHHEPDSLIYHLSHRDVQLSYFGYIQKRIDSLQSGDVLSVKGNKLFDSKGREVIKFSQKFLSTGLSLAKKGYQLTHAKVNYILYWQAKDHDAAHNSETKIVLPELVFEKW